MNLSTLENSSECITHDKRHFAHIKAEDESVRRKNEPNNTSDAHSKHERVETGEEAA